MRYVMPAGVPRLINYIHRNPVRAGVAATTAETSWTSHRAYLGIRHRPSWLDVELGLQLSGFGSVIELDAWIGSNDTTRAELDAIQK